jgi:hypothetical protein
LLFTHGKKGFSSKFGKLASVGTTFHTKQNLSKASSQLQKLLVGDEEAVMRMSEAEFLQLIRSSVKIRGADPSKDAWGTPLRVRKNATKVLLISAGPDRAFATADDIVEPINFGDF